MADHLALADVLLLRLRESCLGPLVGSFTGLIGGRIGAGRIPLLIVDVVPHVVSDDNNPTVPTVPQLLRCERDIRLIHFRDSLSRQHLLAIDSLGSCT